MSTWKERQEWRAAEAKLTPGRWAANDGLYGHAVCFDDKGDGIVLFTRNTNRTTSDDAKFVALARNTYVELLNESDERDRLVVSRAEAVERECPSCREMKRLPLRDSPEKGCLLCRGKGRVLIMPLLDTEDDP